MPGGTGDRRHDSQGDLAEAIEVSRETVSNYEHGHTKPRRITLRLWALATGVDSQWLETGEVPTPRPCPEIAYREALARAGDRERVILRLAAEAGLRRAEVARVHSDDLIEDLEGWSLIVHGKGGRQRVVPLTDSLAAAVRSRGQGWAFPGGMDGHLSPRWVGKVVTRLLSGEATMHQLRHRFATRAYSVDRDVFTVQELLGHASPATTRRYVMVPRSALRDTVRAVAS